MTCFTKYNTKKVSGFLLTITNKVASYNWPQIVIQSRMIYSLLD